MRSTTRSWRIMGVLLTGVLVLSACGGDEGTGDGGDGGATGDGGDGGGGETVSLLHRISGEQEQAALQAAIDAYEESSGNTVEAELSPDFETVIATRVQGGNPPDVGLYPQPGLLEQMLDRGGVVPFSEAGVEVTGEGLVPGMLDTGTFGDTVAGVVVKPSIKSLVYYPLPEFTDNYTVPETWDDLLSLTDEISSTGTPAWCIGIEAGPDTGWVATDWIEDLMLRLHGGDVYDQWVRHEIPFDSPEVTAAFEELAKIWMDEAAVLGGTTGILNTPFGEAAAPMFQDPPGCFLHRQAGFITGNFPEGTEIGTDYDLFAFPPIDDSIGLPILFSGDLAAVHTDKAAAADFVEFLVSAEGQEAWIGHEGAGALSARSDFDPSLYPTPGLRRQGELFANADLARFDASDLMPSQVGAGAFWSETVAWINGSQDLQTTLTNIDAAWPSE